MELGRKLGHLQKKKLHSVKGDGDEHNQQILSFNRQLCSLSNYMMTQFSFVFILLCSFLLTYANYYQCSIGKKLETVCILTEMRNLSFETEFQEYTTISQLKNKCNKYCL